MKPAVLMLASPASARTSLRSPKAFRCEATAYDLSGSREILLATYRGRSPRLSARWLRAEAHKLARLLSPAPGALFLRDAPVTAAGPDAPRPDAELRAWADDDGAYEHALRSLAAGQALMFTATDYDARYFLRAYPLPTRRPAPSQAPVPARCLPHSLAGTGRHQPLEHICRSAVQPCPSTEGKTR